MSFAARKASARHPSWNPSGSPPRLRPYGARRTTVLQKEARNFRLPGSPRNTTRSQREADNRRTPSEVPALIRPRTAVKMVVGLRAASTVRRRHAPAGIRLFQCRHAQRRPEEGMEVIGDVARGMDVRGEAPAKPSTSTPLSTAPPPQPAARYWALSPDSATTRSQGRIRPVWCAPAPLATAALEGGHPILQPKFHALLAVDAPPRIVPISTPRTRAKGAPDGRRWPSAANAPSGGAGRHLGSDEARGRPPPARAPGRACAGSAVLPPCAAGTCTGERSAPGVVSSRLRPPVATKKPVVSVTSTSSA